MTLAVLCHYSAHIQQIIKSATLQQYMEYCAENRISSVAKVSSRHKSVTKC